MTTLNYSNNWTRIAMLQVAFTPIALLVTFLLGGSWIVLVITWVLSAIALIPTAVCMHKLCYVTADNRDAKVTSGMIQLLWLGRFLALTELAGFMAFLVYGL